MSTSVTRTLVLTVVLLGLADFAERVLPLGGESRLQGALLLDPRTQLLGGEAFPRVHRFGGGSEWGGRGQNAVFQLFAVKEGVPRSSDLLTASRFRSARHVSGPVFPAGGGHPRVP